MAVYLSYLMYLTAIESGVGNWGDGHNPLSKSM